MLRQLCGVVRQGERGGTVPDTDGIEPLIHAIYDAAQAAASDPAAPAWAGVFSSMQSRWGLDAWNLLRVGENGAEVLAAGGDRVSAGAPARYTAYYAAIDPRVTLLQQQAPLTLCVTQREFDARSISASEFYQDFLLPEGLLYSMGAMAHRSPVHEYIVGLHRGPDRGVFDDIGESRFVQLLPHLHRALKLGDELAAARARASAAEAARDTMPDAVLSIDLQGKVRDGNRRAEAMLREGRIISLRGGKLRFMAADAHSRLLSGIDRLAMVPVPVSFSLGDVTSQEDRFSVTLLRVRGGQPDDGLLCLITPLGARRVATLEQLADLFGITPAEGRLARALVNGQSVEAYAIGTGLKISTVRTHLRALLVKTGTARQSALVQLIAAIPPVRDPSAR